MRAYLSHIFYTALSFGISHVLVRFFTNWESFTTRAHKTAEIIRSNYVLSHVVIIILLIFMFESIHRQFINRKYSKMAKATNIFFYKANQEENEVSEGYEFLKEIARNCLAIHIQGATGWDTFGAETSPLHNALDNCSEASILLIDPTSASIKQRAAEIDMTEKEYREQIYNSIRYLKELHTRTRSPVNVTLKMYQRYPFWKLIIIDPFVWVQFYNKGKHVKNSPCYAFKSSVQNVEGFYKPFVEQFFLRWNSHRFGVYNFDTSKLEYLSGDTKDILV